MIVIVYLGVHQGVWDLKAWKMGWDVVRLYKTPFSPPLLTLENYGTLCPDCMPRNVNSYSELGCRGRRVIENVATSTTSRFLALRTPSICV